MPRQCPICFSLSVERRSFSDKLKLIGHWRSTGLKQSLYESGALVDGCCVGLLSALHDYELDSASDRLIFSCLMRALIDALSTPTTS